jgi:prephenate dehydrogenase
MFGPSVKDLEGQVVILVPVKGRRFLRKIEAFLGENQARTITTTPSMHDYALGVVQCLTHFAYITVGATLKDVEIDIKQSRSFSSPVYELMLDMIGRILSGNPAMYAEIQISNPYSAEIEDMFLRNAQRLKSAVDAGDSKAFARIMVEAGKHYDDLDSAFSKSSRAVSALYEEYLKIKASVGKRVALRNEVTGAVHVGLIKGISGDYVTVGYGKRTKRLKVSNVTLLPIGESRRLRAEKFGTHQRDISLLFPDHAEPEAIAGLLESCDDDLVSASSIDVYRGKGIPEGLKSITLRLAIFGDLDVIEAERGVKDILTSIGASER